MIDKSRNLLFYVSYSGMLEYWSKKNKLMIQFGGAVREILGKKNIKLSSFGLNKISQIERELKDGRIGNLEEAIGRLNEISNIRLNFEREDYENLRKRMR